jgi:sec-independent protein translocase protein TatA
MRIFKSEVKELQADNKADTPVAPAQPGFTAPAQAVPSERLDVPPPANPTDIRPA